MTLSSGERVTMLVTDSPEHDVNTLVAYADSQFMSVLHTRRCHSTGDGHPFRFHKTLETR